MNDDSVSHLPEPPESVDTRSTGKSELAMLLPPHGWIRNQWLDVGMVLAPLWLYGATLGLLQVVSQNSLYWAVVTLLTVGHHLPSLVRAYGQRGGGRLPGMVLWGAPLVFVAVAGGCLRVGAAGLSVLLVLWGTWHMMSQLYGVMRIYDAKVGMVTRGTIHLDRLMCLSWFVAGILFSTARLEDFLTALYGAGVPPVPPIVVLLLQLIWGGLTAVVTASYIVNYLLQRRQGAMPSLVKLMVMVSGLGFWWYAMVNTRDLLLAVLLFELYHALQSLFLVRVAGGQGVAEGRLAGRWAAVLFRPGMAGAILLGLVTLAYGLPAFLTRVSPCGLGETSAANMWTQLAFVWVVASTMLHYCLEGYVWRLRDEGVRADLRITTVPSVAAPAKPKMRGLGWLLTSGVIVAALWAMAWSQHRERSEEEIFAQRQQFLQNIAESVPQSATAQRELGRFLLASGRAEEAVARLEVARSIDSTSLATVLELGRAQRQSQRIPEATRTFQQAVELAPDSAEACSELGRTLFGQADFEMGIKMLQRAVELAPNNATYQFDLGLATAQVEDFDVAVEALQRAIELQPDFANAYNARGNAYWRTGMLKEALADFDRALSLDPQMGKALRNRAGLYHAQQEWEKALADYTQAIGLPDASWRDYLQRGEVYRQQEQYDKALADLREAWRRSPQRREPVQQLVTLLAACPDPSLRDPEEAIICAEDACQRSQWLDPGALELLAFSHAAAGNFDRAIHWQEQAIKVAPEDTPEAALAALRERVEEYRTAKSQAEARSVNPPQPPDAPAPPPSPPPTDDGGAVESNSPTGGGDEAEAQLPPPHG